ncbi:AfsR/SARP family transcriptional regulator [Phytoactinopolyspora halotolerans]|uniref:AfsR/SARP family transcriptional regulator n=1 Tax=Phytoactinopolyspora halotolerans TaxID=1981512 RepID=A0A6L9S961_9ACTN|nr:AfsR/SARP family transcriptional regulator [Phytoactinopolyspora halotolerans]NEE01609.1 AfsR/SARP family transcriptional regulator [Phytoactinopolyspora halotolerans]
MMRFGVLGPLTVHDDDGRPISPTSSKQRALLAILLCRRNTRVSTDGLLEMLWDAEPPSSARTNLQSYVHRLRRRLGEGRIAHQMAGYELTVKPDESDDDELEQLADHGRQALEAHDPESASRLFRRALNLWRGNTAYADVDHSSVIHAEALRLGELRHVIIELKIDADLDLGRHDALIPELTTLVETYPLRQRHYGQLMLALHRVGRTADALGVYQRARTAMIDELGIEPNGQLRELERAILNGDPMLAAARAPVGSDRRAVPAQSRAPATTLGAGPATAGSAGPAGNDAPHVRSRRELGRNEVGMVLARFLRSLGVDERKVPADVAALADLFASVVPGRSVRVLLDEPHGARRAPLRPDAENTAPRPRRRRSENAR